MKCALCHELLESPVFLPCSCNICIKHVKNQTNNVIRCEKCGVDHQIPTNGFHANNASQVILEAEIANLDLGSVHKSAKESCETLEETLNEFKLLLNDPYFYTQERISELKNAVQLKGEELKLKIDEEMQKLIDRLEEYERQSKEYLSTKEFKKQSKKIEDELKTTQSNLDSWLESLNKIKIDEVKWKSIKEESKQKLKILTEESDKLKNKLLFNKFNDYQNLVNWFKCIKIDPIFEYLSVNREFLDSRIIVNQNLSESLEDLLEKKKLNGRKWSLLYRGTRDGFKASDFHSHCDDKPKTLSIIQSTNRNIFGGFTSAEWESSSSWQFDKKAFIYSLVNKENRPLLFEQSSSYTSSIYSSPSYGPLFGSGIDLVICNSSNTNTNSYSNLGKTYTHPEYSFDSEKAKTILAGSQFFKVQEIEVFQMQ